MKLDIESFNVLCGQIAHRGKLLRKDIQKAAVAAVYFSIQHRNSTPADTLLKVANTSGGLNVKSLGLFFERYGNLAITKDGTKVEFFDRVEMLDEEPLVWSEQMEYELMEETPWDQEAPSTARSQYIDVYESISALIKRVESATKNQTKEVRHGELLVELKALAGKFSSAQLAD